MIQPSNHTCQNCNTKHDSPFQFCSSCGQKNTDGKISFSELWSEFLDAVFNIESRTWLTYKNLFTPGKLTLEYFAGKHRQYLHPLRLLLVTSVFIIIASSFQDFQSATNHGYIIKDRILENYERLRLYRILENIADNTNVTFPEPQTEIITDTILTVFYDSLNHILKRPGDIYGDSINLNTYVDIGFENREIISKHDFLNMDEDELVEAYKKDAGKLDQLIFRQKAKYIKDESQLSAAIMGHFTWSILLMMPCLALVLYLLFIRHKYYYIEHLIFTFHIHAFNFIIFTILIIGLNIFPWWVYLSSFIVMEIYFYISLWRVYNQSKLKTLLKFFILNISYLFLFILFLFGTLIITFLLL